MYSLLLYAVCLFAAAVPGALIWFYFLSSHPVRQVQPSRNAVFDSHSDVIDSESVWEAQIASRSVNPFSAHCDACSEAVVPSETRLACRLSTLAAKFVADSKDPSRQQIKKSCASLELSERTALFDASMASVLQFQFCQFLADDSKPPCHVINDIPCCSDCKGPLISALDISQAPRGCSFAYHDSVAFRSASPMCARLMALKSMVLLSLLTGRNMLSDHFTSLRQAQRLAANRRSLLALFYSPGHLAEAHRFALSLNPTCFPQNGVVRGLILQDIEAEYEVFCIRHPSGAIEDLHEDQDLSRMKASNLIAAVRAQPDDAEGYLCLLLLINSQLFSKSIWIYWQYDEVVGKNGSPAFAVIDKCLRARTVAEGTTARAALDSLFRVCSHFILKEYSLWAAYNDVGVDRDSDSVAAPVRDYWLECQSVAVY